MYQNTNNMKEMENERFIETLVHGFGTWFYNGHLIKHLVCKQLATNPNYMFTTNQT